MCPAGLKKAAIFLLAVLSIGNLIYFQFSSGKKSIEIKTDSSHSVIRSAVNTDKQAQQPKKDSKNESILKVHIVVGGETLSAIAEQYGLDVDSLRGANPDLDELIHPGDKIVILPQKGVLHTVTAGETLWEIANYYQVDVKSIMAANKKHTVDLQIADRLIIPGARPRIIPVSRHGLTRMFWPTEGEITSYFGWRWGRMHQGIDIANKIGTIIKAVANGRVQYAGWQTGYGNIIIVDHGHNFQTVYAHLADFAVREGEYVGSGQILGYMGSSGYSTGPHLHFEVRYGGEPQNPIHLLP